MQGAVRKSLGECCQNSLVYRRYKDKNIGNQKNLCGQSAVRVCLWRSVGVPDENCQ